jgi:hypothetical protein
VRHVGNARKRTETILDDKERPMHTLSKESAHSPLFIDGAIGITLAKEAQGDCIAAGAYIGDDIAPDEQPKVKQWQPGWRFQLARSSAAEDKRSARWAR